MLHNSEVNEQLHILHESCKELMVDLQFTIGWFHPYQSSRELPLRICFGEVREVLVSLESCLSSAKKPEEIMPLIVSRLRVLTKELGSEEITPLIVQCQSIKKKNKAELEKVS